MLPDSTDSLKVQLRQCEDLIREFQQLADAMQHTNVGTETERISQSNAASIRSLRRTADLLRAEIAARTDLEAGKSWCGRRESNPPLKLGKLTFYR